ncbi:endonuclease III [Ktedonosporobacter rubrisoli]|uniref:Endonuclease III n=1 Tax=Ktedonosporobacter rubrisoli TaxID=2509675 RepID=A0A4P6JPT0_KTERU|nr:endonuclease III [Ktedonosporobacter rubrisoli]QBD77102.1 endonuclease III [Ktedonosporobacter rubrisoli]
MVYTGPQPGSSEQISAIVEELRGLYPQARYELNFTTPLELLVATILAAQCTDERVNAVTPQLFAKYRSAQDYAQVGQEELEQDVKSTGFYRNKAKTLRAVCQYLVDHYHGEVPQSIDELVKLPGVARKTANVVLVNAFGVTEGFIVDTHVGRVSKRLGWTQHEDAARAEQELMRLIPRSEWSSLPHRMIYHGRATCAARKPRCTSCTLVAYCPSAII